MDLIIALTLIEGFLILLAIATYKAIGFISPPLHADESCKGEAVSVSTVSSSSYIDVAATPATKYDVFLSFRGEDTRNNFTSYLYEALCKANIQTFMDHKLHKGEDISPVLLRTIEESEISVIIFSADYASSTWCLDELVHILECKKKFGRVVIPIFYKIDPSNVSKQSESFGDGFDKLKQRFKDNSDKVRRWENALTQSTSLFGWDSKNTRPETKLIKTIVEDILSKLNYCTSSSSCHLEGLVGINHQIEKIEELLVHARIVGIWGMGGIGKTTLAKAVFHNLKARFEASSFVGNVREQLAKIGLNKIMEECLKELLKDEGLHVYNMKSIFVKRRLQQKSILLILDDVDNLLKIEDLTKLCDWFGEGSRIIVTSRDMQVLKNSSVSTTYLVQKLEFSHALNLFSLKAFKQNEPFKSYLELSKLVVGYCQGNPLALVVLGCFLYCKTKEVWESALEKLKQAPYKDISNVLKLSFDGLDEKQKNVFLDLAHLLRETSKTTLSFIRGFYNFSAYIEINVLKERSLILMDQLGGIEMHDLVREMGQEICRQQLIIDPEKPIRLWKHNDIYHFFINNKGSGTIRHISLDMSKTKKITLKANAFQKMKALKFLKFYKSDSNKPSKVYVSEGLDNLPDELRFFFWEEYPQPSVPLSFCAENLMELEMPHNQLQQLWDANQHFPNLGVMNLTASKQMIELPNLSQAPNMRMIYLDECVNLTQIYSSSSLNKLSHLSIRDCKDLRHINIGGNIKETSSGLVAVYNFVDLSNSLFHKLTVKLFVSNDGNTFSGFRVKLVSVLLSDLLSSSDDQNMNNNIEGSKLKLSSLLPFVTSLRWLDLTEFGNFNEHFNFFSDHEDLTTDHSKDEINELTAMAREPLLELEDETITEEAGITGFTISYLGERKPLIILEIEEDITMTEIMECYGLTRVPNSITRWTLLTQVTLQRSEIIGCEVWNINPGISMLKSVEESGCCKRIQPVIDIRISLDKEAIIWGGNNNNNNDIAGATKWDMPNLNIDIWQQFAGGDVSVHFPIRLTHDSISFLFWFLRRRIST